VSSSGSFQALIERLRDGSDDAAAEIFRVYAGRLIALARTRLDRYPGIRRKVDAEDVLQSVFKSFFQRQAKGQFDLKDRDSLWGLLVVMTLRKVSRKVKRYHGREHDVRKEIGSPWDGSDPGSWEAIAPEPTPAEAAVLADTVEQLMSGLDERDRKILTLRLQGCTAREIGDEVGLTQYTVEAVLKRVRKLLKKRMDDAEE
jgi:RNA polymerase sigma-70 factor (ECF subfamily)